MSDENVSGSEPLIHMSFCPDKPILAGFLGSFAPCSVSTLAGHYDDEGVISLWQRVVNVMQSACRVVSQKWEGLETEAGQAITGVPWGHNPRYSGE